MRLRTAADSADAYAALASSSLTLIDSTTTLVSGVGAAKSSAQSAVGSAGLRGNGSDRCSHGSGLPLSRAPSTHPRPELDTLSTSVENVYSTASTSAADASASLRSQAGVLDSHATTYEDIKKTLKDMPGSPVSQSLPGYAAKRSRPAAHPGDQPARRGDRPRHEDLERANQSRQHHRADCRRAPGRRRPVRRLRQRSEAETRLTGIDPASAQSSLSSARSSLSSSTSTASDGSDSAREKLTSCVTVCLCGNGYARFCRARWTRCTTPSRKRRTAAI